jgi:sulfate transport system permease protein
MPTELALVPPASSAPAGPPRVAGVPVRRAAEDPAWVRTLLVGTALAVVGLLVIVPVASVFVQAFGDGVAAYWHNLFGDPDTRDAMKLTLTVVPIAVGANVVFGVAAAWAIARFRFPGRTLLTALIDLPFSVSPVVAGLMFVLIFGLQGYLGPFLRRDGYSVVPYLVSLLLSGITAAVLLFLRQDARAEGWKRSGVVIPAAAALAFALSLAIQLQLHVWPRGESLKIIFATPGLVLATTFVTLPFVARELIPVMEALGPDEEMAALSLGAGGWRIFRDITLPNIKWGLAYGIILCNARAMGEFGAVYVVSGHITGQTDTMPLRIEKLFQEYNLPGAFAVASLLTFLAILTLIAKVKLESRLPAAARGARPIPQPSEEAPS